MIHVIFQVCVWALNQAGQWLGIGYEAINVWVFVIIWPALTVALIVIVIRQARRLHDSEMQAQERERREVK